MKKNKSPKGVDLLIKTIFILLILVALFLFYFLVQHKISGQISSIAGYQLYIVMSGSMSPTINTGSLVVVKPVGAEEIRPKDIITFRSDIESEHITTHRVIEIDKDVELYFITQGDANEVEDPLPVNSNQLVGKVVFSIPYVGYAIYFVRSKRGVIILLGVLIALINIELTSVFSKEKKWKQDDGHLQKETCDNLLENSGGDQK